MYCIGWVIFLGWFFLGMEFGCVYGFMWREGREEEIRGGLEEENR